MELQPEMSSCTDVDNHEVTRRLRVVLILSVPALQLVAIYVTHELYAWIPHLKYVDMETSWDRHIPYMAWSWTVYYFGLVYPVVWCAAGLWRLPRSALRRTVGIYYALIVTGALLHLAIPTQAPWPLVPGLAQVQQSFKTVFAIRPLACFPSMHVALAVFPASIGCCVFRYRFNRIVSVILSFAIAGSVITAKEHWLFDALAGLILGLLAYRVWKRYAFRGCRNQVFKGPDR